MRRDSAQHAVARESERQRACRDGIRSERLPTKPAAPFAFRFPSAASFPSLPASRKPSTRSAWRSCSSATPTYCDYPPAAAKKHKVGGAINPSLEEIAALHPDLVLVTKSLNRLETVQQLDRLGIAAYATDPHTVDEIRTSVHRLADVLGNPAARRSPRQPAAAARIATCEQRLRNVPPKRVLFVVWTDPLISIGKNTFIADALAHAGATSVVDSSQDWPQISLEEMVRLQPEFLVFASSHSESVSRDVDALAKRPGWDPSTP